MAAKADPFLHAVANLVIEHIGVQVGLWILYHYMFWLTCYVFWRRDT
jgi:hypothetical protein